MKPEQAYPGISFTWRSRNWWSRLTRVPAECVHLENEVSWMATFVPDILYLRGKATVRRRPARPEVSLCRACLLGELESELGRYSGRVVAFEPDGDAFSQYFFVAPEDFPAAGLEPQTDAAITRLLQRPAETCERCDQAASWLWIPREEVASLDEVGKIAMAQGEALCRRHGAQKLCEALTALSEANLFYINVPYGDAGAYLWI